ncbi:MAG: c-type cytochrome [Bacteroidota bacterium]
MAYHRKFLPALLIFCCLFMGSISLSAQEEAAAETASLEGTGDYNTGKKVWNANGCGGCHAKSMAEDGTGPALGGVQERWSAEPREHLYEWIQNNGKLRTSGKSARAVEVYEAWNGAAMNLYPGITNQDVEHLLAYIKGQYTGEGKPVAEVASGGGAGGPAQKTDNTWLFVVLGVALLLLSLILARVTSNMQYMVATKEGENPTRRTLLEILTSKGMIAFVLFALVVLGGYTTVNNAIELGRQQDYMPEQPIKFSHVTHAGLNKIECQYCHDGARRSKHSVIPAVNTCMNCHRAIKVGSQYGTAEITKIYAAIGYDPKEDKYIENYDELSNDEIKEIYRSWIADNAYKAASEKSDDVDLDEIKEEENRQLAAIEAALTNEYTGDDKIAGPVEWVRIHNLPDHAYFNHAQHVTVGKLKCQNCHGPVEEMELVYQYSPLSMGWCVNCHRETEVQFKDNDYYKAYERYHEEMKAGDRKAVTVEDIGGLNCQRCHY